MPHTRCLRRSIIGRSPILWAFLLAALPVQGWAWERGPLNDYHQRRVNVVRETSDGIVVLYGNPETDVAASVTSFRQNENFYYLTGWNQPDAILMLVPGAAKTLGASPEAAREILFIPASNPEAERWNGPEVSPGSPKARALSGFSDVESREFFPEELRKALKKFPKIYTELTPQPESGEECVQQAEVAELHKLARHAAFADLRPLVSRMRAVKSPEEIALIRKATEASMDAQLGGIRAVRPGVWEYQIATLMKYEFERRGCEWPAYPPIVGSGFFSTVLHYDRDDHQMQSGDVVVMDVAGSYSGYASDMTRTVPVDGHFTPRQREIYDIVLGAEQAVRAAAKPGMILARGGTNSLYDIAYNYINTHGRDLHGRRLGRYFIHGVGHSVGLNVHDPMDTSRPLEPGMVITDEPGIYIPEEKLGVRIEDLLLITSDGAEVLTQRLPRTAEEIEQLMSAK